MEDPIMDLIELSVKVFFPLMTFTYLILVAYDKATTRPARIDFHKPGAELQKDNNPTLPEVIPENDYQKVVYREGVAYKINPDGSEQRVQGDFYREPKKYFRAKEKRIELQINSK